PPFVFRGLLARSGRGLLLGVPSLSSPLKELYNPRAFITHAAWLDQACAHCPIFPTAASRRSLGRVSVPVRLVILSDQLPIVALGSRYLTNKLIGRVPFLRQYIFPRKGVFGISRSFPELFRTEGRVATCYSPGCRCRIATAARLACVRPAASVRSEPGSNSQVG